MMADSQGGASAPKSGFDSNVPKDSISPPEKIEIVPMLSDKDLTRRYKKVIAGLLGAPTKTFDEILEASFDTETYNRPGKGKKAKKISKNNGLVREGELTRGELKDLFLLTFATAYRRATGNSVFSTMPINSEPERSHNFLKRTVIGLFQFIDFLLFSLGSLLLDAFRKYVLKQPVQSVLKKGRSQRALGYFLTEAHTIKLRKRLDSLFPKSDADDHVVFSKRLQEVSDKHKDIALICAQSFHSYKPGFQQALWYFGLGLSASYGIGSAVMVGFFIATLSGLMPFPLLIFLMVLFCLANLIVNSKFAMGYMPRVFTWMFGQGGFMRGMYFGVDQHGNEVELNGTQKAIVRSGFAMSFLSAIAMTSLTFIALVATISIFLNPLGTFIISAFIAIVTLVMLTVVFASFWSNVALSNGVISFMIDSYRNMLRGLEGPKKWATIAMFIFNLFFVSVGFAFLAIICLGPTARLTTPLITYLGIGPGILAQVPNIIDFSSKMARLFVDFIDDHYVTEIRATLDWLNPGRFMIPAAIMVTLALIVREVTLFSATIGLISFLCVPLLFGHGALMLISKLNRSFLNKAAKRRLNAKLQDGFSLRAITYSIFSPTQGRPGLMVFNFFKAIVALAMLPGLLMVAFVHALDHRFDQPHGSTKGEGDESTAKAAPARDDASAKEQDDEEVSFGRLAGFPDAATHVLLMVEVLSNAVAYGAAHFSTFVSTLLTTGFFTYCQRILPLCGATVLDHDDKLKAVSDRHALTLKPLEVEAGVSEESATDPDVAVPGDILVLS